MTRSADQTRKWVVDGPHKSFVGAVMPASRRSVVFDHLVCVGRGFWRFVTEAASHLPCGTATTYPLGPGERKRTIRMVTVGDGVHDWNGSI
jgi:hypothetical protein